MNKWEYIYTQHSTLIGNVINTNGKVIAKGQKMEDFIQYCNELGSQGWEAVGTNNEHGIIGILLKRPKN